MMRRFVCFAIALLSFGLAACSDSDAQTGTQDVYNAYVGSIDRSCKADTDCAVKDVGNCCGYYPECVNVNAVLKPEIVRNYCAEMKMAGVCGFPSIESCACVNNACAPSGLAGGPVAQ